jgi:TonB-dependent starch-binding outer membrane protein SusC
MRKIYKLLNLPLAIMLMLVSSQLFAQSRVSGKISDEAGQAVPGASILEKGTSNGTVSDANGDYALTTSGSNATLVVTFIGYKSQEFAVGTRSVIDVSMEPDVTALQEVVVTGYTTEKKADIIGAVSVVKGKDINITPSADVSAMLQGRATGVITSGGGAPGEGATVQIRGLASFGDTGPLYVIDGVPTNDASRVNPNDIESLQVLKDATASSIYGSRAASGVIIITTKQGKSGTLTIDYNNYVGTSYIPSSAQPELLNTKRYAEYLKLGDPTAIHPVFGLQGNINPDNLPGYIVVSPGLKGGFAENSPQVDPSLYSIKDFNNIYQILKVSEGTNWFDAVTRSGKIQNHQISASGGTEKSSFSLSFNYFSQEGTYKYADFERFSARINSSFKPNEYFRFGENLNVTRESSLNAAGTGNARGEASAWAQAFRMVPYIPVNDIQGGWGGNGVGNSGNGTNPLAQLYRDKDDQNYRYKVFGNVFLEAFPIKNLTLRTSFGIDYGNFFNKDIIKQTYERSENTRTTGLNQSYNYDLSWTWTNTLAYSRTFGDHNAKILLGTETVRTGIGDGISVGVSGFDFEDPQFVNLNTRLNPGPVVSSTEGTIRTLASIFGRVDYGYKDKYLFNATVRRDGSSVFGSANRYGVFPAFGVAWRMSQESFMSNLSSVISDLKIRGGWGQMGNQTPVNPNNQYGIFRSNPGLSNYDINRSQTSLATGYTQINASSNATKWETSESTNVGFDASLWQGKLDVSFSYFNTDTKDLLVTRPRNGLDGILQQPAINLGKMRNNGVEVTVSKRGNIIPGLQYDASVNFTHYTNTAIDIDGNPKTFFANGASRLANVWRTEAGRPMSSFYGYELDGFFNNANDLAALDQPGKVIGGWRYKDRDGNGKIDDDDRTFIGNPQPKFVMGFNFGLKYKNFDLTAFAVWNYGNDLYNYTKYWTDMRVFVGGVSPRVLDNGWTPTNNNALLPRLAGGADNGYTSFTTSTSNNYYIESGSYLRLKTIQIGYTVPFAIASKVKLTKARVYIQGQNMLTITNYSGPDPDIGIQGGVLSMGLDNSTTPNPRQLLVGVNLSF